MAEDRTQKEWTLEMLKTLVEQIEKGLVQVEECTVRQLPIEEERDPRLRSSLVQVAVVSARE